MIRSPADLETSPPQAAARDAGTENLFQSVSETWPSTVQCPPGHSRLSKVAAADVAPLVSIWRSLCVPMDGVDRKCGQANRDIFGAFWRAVADPLPRFSDNRLTGIYDRFATFMLHDHFSGEHQRKFLELRALARLGPSRGTAHVRDARVRIAGIDPADVLVENFS